MGAFITSVSFTTRQTWYANYRPIQVDAVSVDTNTTWAYCDVYFGGVYYKTLVTNIFTTDGTYNYFSFDIENAAQERLEITTPGLILAAHSTKFTQVIDCFVRVRGGYINSDGLLVQETPIPIQGTGNTAPVEGGGLQSDGIYIIVATLQQIAAQRLTTHLRNYRQYLGTTASYADHYKCYPLTHQLQEYMAYGDYGSFCFLLEDGGFYDGVTTGNIGIHLQFHSTTIGLVTQKIFQFFYDDTQIVAVGCGTKDIDAYRVSSSLSALDWTTIDKYRLIITDEDVVSGGLIDKTMCQSPWYFVGGQGSNRTCIWFINYLGGTDMISFLIREESHEIQSKTKERLLRVQPTNQNKNQFALSRTQSTSNESNMVTISMDEDQMRSFKELLDSPYAWVVWRKADTSILGTAINDSVFGQNAFMDGQNDQLVSLKIEDKKNITFKADDRGLYEVTFAYKLSQRNILIQQ